jgi:vitamin B12 transporter
MKHFASKLKACIYSTFFSGLVILSPNISLAQNTEVLPDTLAEIKVTASKYILEPIYQPVQLLLIDQEILRLTGATNLSSLLSSFGHAHVRSYGPGLAAGITQRGFTTSSFQIIRDGFVINNPLYGQVDLALIPLDLISSGEGANANASSAYGSAALGGSLVLHSDWKPSYSLSQSFGSFGYNQTSISAGEKIGNASLLLQLGRNSAENNFSFTNPLNEQLEIRSNNAINKQWLRMGISNRWGTYLLQTNVIAIRAEREIPDAIVFSPANAVQNDSEIRLSTIISPIHSNRWTASFQAYHNSIEYKDVYINEPSDNQIQSASFNTSVHLINVQSIKVRFENGLSHTVANSNNFEGLRSRNTFNSSVQGQLNKGDKLFLFPSIRFDWISDVDYALSYSTGINLPLIPQKLHLRSQFSRNFTVPTLNDLYWAYGGNPELLPETSNKADIGYHVQLNFNDHFFEFQGQAYKAVLDNGIIWRPIDQFQWSPQNIQQISSHGFEQSLRWNYSIGDFSADIRSQVTYTAAEISRSRFDGDKALGRQLPYTPKWMVKIQPGFRFNKTDVSFEYTYDGKRFISDNNTSLDDPLSSFFIINGSIIQGIKMGKIKSELKLNINNILNERYNLLNWYPLPGRSITTSLKIKL